MLGLKTALYKLAINAAYPGGVDSMFETSVITANEGDTTMIAWRHAFAAPGGQFDALVSQWLQLATASGGQGLSASQAVAQIATLRANAATMTI